MNSSSRFLAVAAAALVVASMGTTVQAAPAAAATFKPDGWVRYKSLKTQSATYIEPTAWVGDNVYNLTGRNQKEVQTAGGNYDTDPHFVFELRAQNDGSADRFKVHAAGTGDWVVRYYHATTEITAAVTAGTYLSPNVGSGRSVTLKVKVWLGNPGTHIMRLITLTSVGNEAKQDAVKIRVNYTLCGC